MRTKLILSTLIALAACSATITAGGPDRSTHGVSIAASVRSRTSNGDSVTIQISNVGTRIEFFSRCGSSPLLLMQQLVDNVWTGGVQNFLCVAPTAPGPVRLAPGESINLVRVLSLPGRFRFVAPVGEMEDLSDATQVASNAFDIP